MDRQQFLDRLQTLWMENGEMEEVLTVEDLMDDSASIGLLGASDVYLKLMSKEDETDVA